MVKCLTRKNPNIAVCVFASSREEFMPWVSLVHLPMAVDIHSDSFLLVRGHTNLQYLAEY